MSNVSSSQPRSSIGIVGFGAFGRLLATHLAPHFALRAYDPLLPPGVYHGQHAVEITHLPTVAGCPIVVLATPVRCLADVIGAIGPHLKPGAVMIDVGSVKSVPAELMLKHLPADVGIVATHPLFGPQSARSGIRGLKIAVCPVRGWQGYRVAAFLRKTLGLDVIVTTPDAHDRDAATVQGLTHLVAKILIEMEPLPTRMTTRSFDLLMQAVGMVRADAPDVFDAIERLNPYARGVRQRFLALASSIDAELAASPATGSVTGGPEPSDPIRLGGAPLHRPRIVDGDWRLNGPVTDVGIGPGSDIAVIARLGSYQISEVATEPRWRLRRSPTRPARSWRRGTRRRRSP